jgi:hypothetical protein
MRGGATFDATGAFRYHLWREWDAARPSVTFVMLNPSTADALHDDPTIRRCLGFARDWGYGRLEVVNLLAFRATIPRDLLAAVDPIGPANHRWLQRAVRANDTIAAWGNTVGLLASHVSPSLRQRRGGRGVRSLGLTKLGHPRHPLYVPRSTVPQPFSSAPYSE